MQQAFIDGWNEGQVKAQHDQNIFNMILIVFLLIAVAMIGAMFTYDAYTSWKDGK